MPRATVQTTRATTATSMGIRIAMLVLGWAGIALNFTPGVRVDVVLSYYTIQSNLLALAWTTLVLFLPAAGKARAWLLRGIVHGSITVYIMTTFIIFAVMLSASWHPTGIYAYINLSLHYLVPVMFFLDWFITPRSDRCKWRYCVYWLAYPLAYLALTLARGVAGEPYVYYFLDLNALGPAFFALSCVIMAGWFVLLGAVIVLLDRKVVTRLVRVQP